MSIKKKMTGLWNKLTRKNRPQKKTKDGGSEENKSGKTDAEISADDVVREELFPKNAVTGKRRRAKKTKDGGSEENKSGKTDAEISADDVVHEELFPKNAVTGKRRHAKNDGKKPASKRTRPTNPCYTMIDPNDDTCDTGKS